MSIDYDRRDEFISYFSKVYSPDDVVEFTCALMSIYMVLAATVDIEPEQFNEGLDHVKEDYIEQLRMIREKQK